MSKESVVRYALPDPQDPFQRFQLVHVPEGYRIANRKIPLKIQDAIASASDLGIAPAITDFLNSYDLSPEEQTESREGIMEQIFDLKARLSSLGIPVRTLEGRLNYVKRMISAERRKDKIVNFAFRFGVKTARQYLLGDSRSKLTASEKNMLDSCGYFSAWEVLGTKLENDIFRNKNPFEPILGMFSYGICEFTFVRSRGIEKISTYLTPVREGEKPIRIIAA